MSRENYAGGTDNDDNSGTLRYVRIEFAGFDVSRRRPGAQHALDVRGGPRHHARVRADVAGLDDSFEWWGGAVDGRYLVSYESGDDHFDWSEGYRGRNQFLIAFQTTRLIRARAPAALDRSAGFEGDGCNGAGCDARLRQPAVLMPVFANFTLVGRAPASSPARGDSACAAPRHRRLSDQRHHRAWQGRASGSATPRPRR